MEELCRELQRQNKTIKGIINSFFIFFLNLILILFKFKFKF